MKFRTTAVLALFALVLVAACATAPGPERDAWIQDQVSSKISRDVSLEGQQINVSVENGQVLLSGTISDSSHRTKAIALAGSVSGVNSVLDRLELASS